MSNKLPGLFRKMNSKLAPFVWGAIVMLLALALLFSVAPRQEQYLEENQIISPEVTLGPVLAYFFGVVAIMAVVLFLIPGKRLQLAFRLLFPLGFAWGLFIIIALTINT